MVKNLEKNYNPKDFEDKIYKSWLDSGAFTPDINEDKTPFTVIMPPPNITGQLHMGHAIDHFIQDALIRFKRMQGFSALWIPGTDHASIATEKKVIDKLREEGIEKSDLSREEFLKHAWEWKEEYGNRIVEQFKKLGDSCDFTRQRFTLDETCNDAVNEFFVSLYEKGYIYRGERIINWCPDCHTTLSDAEVEHEDVDGHYWHIKYEAVDGSEPIVIATSRPETMFADVAIAVSPEDDRYRGKIGKKYYIPVINREIPLITDEYPDMEKGTGAVKITPAHDMNDFSVGLRHDLELLYTIDFDGNMTELSGKYEGKDRYTCRKEWVKELEEKGYLVEVEDKEIPVGTCYRCHTAVEPMISKQWFVKMADLAKPAIKACESGDLEFTPKRFEKIYFNWLNDIRDWCISRQLYWGHQIPAYYCDECGEITVSKDEPKSCKCGCSNLRRDEDVLDTWFSSALWPVSTLGWPNTGKDFDYFFPTNVLVTGYDIIFFWVIRMVFSSLEITDKVPFSNVYVHGLVRDAKGQKMSKSLGNGIDPLEVIDKYGSDALRFMMLIAIAPGNDMRFTEDRLEGARNFANKLWNAGRFLIMNLEGIETVDLSEVKDLKVEDKWILKSLNNSIDAINTNMDKSEFGLAGQKIYDLIWNQYCDWYVEVVKSRLYGEDEKDKTNVLSIMRYVYTSLLKLLHPFMPFITEEIYGYISLSDEMLISSTWPEIKKENDFEVEFTDFEYLKEIIKNIRNVKAEYNLKNKDGIDIYLKGDSDKVELLKENMSLLKDLCGVEKILDEIDENNAVKFVIDSFEVLIPMTDLVDLKEELQRLKAEEKRLNSEVKRCEGKLSNDGFAKQAPKKVVDMEREKLQKYRNELAVVKSQIERLED